MSFHGEWISGQRTLMRWDSTNHERRDSHPKNALFITSSDFQSRTYWHIGFQYELLDYQYSTVVLIVIEHRQALDSKSSQTGNNPLPFTFNVSSKYCHQNSTWCRSLSRALSFVTIFWLWILPMFIFSLLPVHFRSLPVQYRSFPIISGSLPVTLRSLPVIPSAFSPPTLSFRSPLFVRKRGHHLL